MMHNIIVELKNKTIVVGVLILLKKRGRDMSKHYDYIAIGGRRNNSTII